MQGLEKAKLLSAERQGMTLEKDVREILNSRSFGFLATVNPDGSPHVTPVWLDEKNGFIRVNTAVGRVKERNTRRDPRVCLSIPDPSNPYRYVFVRGRVVEWVTGEEADRHIDELAIKYTGEKFRWWGSSPRVILVVKPERVGVF